MNDMKRLLLAVGVAFLATSAMGRRDCGDCKSDCKSDCDCTPCTDKCTAGFYTNKTYFADRIGPWQSGAYMHEVFFCNKRMWKAEDGWGGAFQIVPFGGKTTKKGSKELAEWFGLNHKWSLVATLASNPTIPDLIATGGDLDATHFNISQVATTGTAAFSSTISFCPQQKRAGVVLDWKQALWRNTDDTVRVWGEINCPIVWTSNCMRFKEVAAAGNNINLPVVAPLTYLDDATPVLTMEQAFNQPTWKYGKMCPCPKNCNKNCTTTATTTTTTCTTNCAPCGDKKGCDNCRMKRTGVADLELKLGYNTVMSECCVFDSYVGVVFPTGNKPHACCVFEPINGNGKHWGLMIGSDIAYEVGHWDCAAFKVRMDIDCRYLFKHDEMRSFDLVGKPWSRYQAMFVDSTQAAAAAAVGGNPQVGTSGINIMTRCVKVKPHFQLNWNTGFMYQGECFLGEVGLTCYARQNEEICPNWTNTLPALKAYVAPDFATDVLTTTRTIRDRNTNANITYTADNYNLVAIKKCDVDWQSAAHPGLIHGSVYGALGWQWDSCCYPTFVAVGGAYDFSSGNAGMRRWNVFGKLGFSF